MADSNAICSVENEQQFWDTLNEIVSAPCTTHELLDDALRSWLSLVTSGRDRYLDSEDDVASCSQKLLDSYIFCKNKEYVRTQIIYSLLQEDEHGPLHAIANFLLLDGRTDEATFRRMIDEGCFTRLLELIKSCGGHDRRLHRLLLELMYEMSRIERLRLEDLIQVDDNFVIYLFQLIESLSDDVNDPYHYPVIRVLLVLNEQYMVAATSAAVDPLSPSAPLTNRVVKMLSIHGPSYRTFGENIILLLNRETETALQLLILKLLYLLFTTTATYEYFYTNDLRVLLDVIIRNLLDLPSEMNVLRHTYLRVLAPLLSHTQLSQPPHYKRDQILSLLDILRGAGNVHFTPPDPTTLRLLDRVANTPWLLDDDEPELPIEFAPGSLSVSQTGSTVSVIAQVSEKPGVQTPSRKADAATEVASGRKSEGDLTKPQVNVLKPKKSLPEVPKHRHGMPVPPPPTIITTVHMNGNGQKRSPPKLPPPRRRTKLKTVTAGEGLGAPE
ncbi:hypothetical protein QBC46DRAFT_383388 [Diplogelasinospora grovesii]|uniref:SPIN90/Ldb17 leucine-rich domain-containing protein n=1 Tax=Diplogelasinospora grovesii TaxID=303347 RepID=A0AAN6N8J0_9PEZI|nr:hypothetical protein QBC46DRAFT_383388 [Diplogelasinospora grovesii]